MINQKFIVENMEDLVSLRDAEEISNYAKEKNIDLNLDEIYSIKNFVEQNVNLLDEKKSILSLDDLSEVAGGNSYTDAGNGVIIATSVISAPLAFIPGVGIGLSFALNTLGQIVGNLLKGKGMGMDAEAEHDKQIGETAKELSDIMALGNS